MKNTLSIRDAKSRFSEIIHSVEEGSDIIITNRNKPVAKITSYSSKKKRNLVQYKMEGFELPKDFDAPISLFE